MGLGNQAEGSIVLQRWSEEFLRDLTRNLDLYHLIIFDNNLLGICAKGLHKSLALSITDRAWTGKGCRTDNQRHLREENKNLVL